MAARHEAGRAGPHPAVQTSDARARRRATTQAARKAAAHNGCPDKPELLLHRARGGRRGIKRCRLKVLDLRVTSSALRLAGARRVRNTLACWSVRAVLITRLQRRGCVLDGSQTDMGAQAEAAAALSGGGAKTVAAAHSSSLPAAVNSVFASLEPVTGDGRVNDPWAVAMLLTPRALRPVWRLLAWLAPARAVRTLAVASERCLAHSRRLLAAARAAAKEPPPGGTTADGASPLSLFSLLTCNGIAAAVARHGSGAAALLSDDAIMSHSHTMLLAGVETTAAMIAFAFSGTRLRVQGLRAGGGQEAVGQAAQGGQRPDQRRHEPRALQVDHRARLHPRVPSSWPPISASSSARLSRRRGRTTSTASLTKYGLLFPISCTCSPLRIRLGGFYPVHTADVTPPLFRLHDVLMMHLSTR